MNFNNSQEHATHYSEWIVKCFATENLKLDYTIESLRNLDIFIDKNSKNGKINPNGILAQNGGTILYGMGIYTGETIIKNTNDSTWEIPNLYKEDPETAIIKLQNGAEVFPVAKVFKRFYNGEEDSIYPYGIIVITEMTKNNYWENLKNKSKESLKQPKKAWWKLYKI